MNPLKLQTEFDNRSYVPGDVLRGTASWQMDESREMIVRLFYYTSGRGTRDVEIVETKTFAPSTAGGESFEFTLPEGPYTFSGQLISLIWALERESIKGKGATERIEFVLSPSGQEIDLATYTTDEMARPKTVFKFGK